LDTCFIRIQEAGLNVKADKCSFSLSEISYLLGYIISHEGRIKPDPPKILGIASSLMDLNRPRTTTEVSTIIGIVQYYRDLWRQ
jgi:hypothetical protein